MDVPKHVIREVVRRDKVFRNPDRMDARAKRRREEHEALPAVAMCSGRLPAHRLAALQGEQQSPTHTDARSSI